MTNFAWTNQHAQGGNGPQGRPQGQGGQEQGRVGQVGQVLGAQGAVGAPGAQYGYVYLEMIWGDNVYMVDVLG